MYLYEHKNQFRNPPCATKKPKTKHTEQHEIYTHYKLKNKINILNDRLHYQTHIHSDTIIRATIIHICQFSPFHRKKRPESNTLPPGTPSIKNDTLLKKDSSATKVNQLSFSMTKL